jgi:hypothetical protein
VLNDEERVWQQNSCTGTRGVTHVGMCAPAPNSTEQLLDLTQTELDSSLVQTEDTQIFYVGSSRIAHHLCAANLTTLRFSCQKHSNIPYSPISAIEAPEQAIVRSAPSSKGKACQLVPK